MKFLPWPIAATAGFLGAFSLFTSVALAESTLDADRATLLKGVTEIGAPGVPGGVSAYGPQAFAVVAGKDGKKAQLPVVAATRWEKGRIVAFGHNGYLGDFQNSGTGALLANAARWAGSDKPKPKIAVIKNSGLAGYLKSAGLDADAVEEKDWTKSLARFDAVCVDAHKLSAEDVSIYDYPPANAIKIVMPRKVVSGSPDDTDVDGKQQHAPLLDIPIP